ncbi:MAG: hypothetical protein HYY17_15585 [Planctomycetes bacterium]|nr:hypothetical protein [Planctomycetota bacterium]
MTRLVAAAILLLAALGARAQEVQLTLTDGTIVTGELKGFEGGKYRVMVGGEIREYKESEVVTLVVVERGRTDPPVTDPVAEAKRRLGEGQDAGKAASWFAQALKGLSRSDRERLVDVLQSTLTARIQEPFVGDFADALPRQEGLPAELKPALARAFESVAKAAEKERRARSAWKLYRGAAALDPDGADAVRAARLAQALADATARFNAGEAVSALEAAEEILSLAPDHAEGRRIREEALHRKLRMEMAANPERKAQLLRDYLKAARREEYRKWAEAELGRTPDRPETPTVSIGDATRYYPVAAGLFWRYRVGEKSDEKEIFQKVRIQEVQREEGVLRVTLESSYGSGSSGQSYQILVGPDSVSQVPVGDQAPFPILRFPAQAGLSWPSKSGAQVFLRQITSVAATATTASGAFGDCLEVTFTGTMPQAAREGREEQTIKIVSRSYYAPGVGLVKLEFDDAEYRKKYNLDLVERGKE